MITKISLRVKGLKERKRELTMGKKLVSVKVQRVEGIWYAKEKQQALVLGKYGDDERGWWKDRLHKSL